MGIPGQFSVTINTKASFRTGLNNLPDLNTDGLRDCQITAITNLEVSLKSGKPRALVQMATGSGKTFTAITQVYRLLKHAGARRILFLVDTKNLGEQAEQEFMAFVPNDDNRKFTELYNVQRLTSPSMANDTQVVISTIQRMYATLKGEDLSEGTEDENPAEQKWRRKEPLPVVYNPKLPPEYFDVVVIDECHRSIYNLWRQVIEYFDAFLVGLTATPDNRTFGFFKKNVVSEYTHEKAVADKVNVGNEVFIIETEVTKKGTTIHAEQLVEKRERDTRAKRWETQDEDEAYAATQIDRSVVVPDQIRSVIRTFRDKWQDIFPGRTELPKTLIFAKTDSHADDIIQTVREEFGEGNNFCRKITNGAKNPKSSLTSFRNEYYPRIAVTVDMIATGTDVKPLECLLFMRDVKSKNYFEQMKGRGTRVVKPDDLKKVSPSASAKTHYVIIDAVGVTKSLKTSSQPLDSKPSIPFKDLAMGLMMGDRSEETVSSLAGRLSRLDHKLSAEDQEKIAEEAGKPLAAIVRDLFDAIDPDKVEADAKAAGHPEPDDAAMNEAREKRIAKAANVFTGPIIKTLDTIRRDNEQTIDHDTMDKVTVADWAGDADENAKAIAQEFEEYLKEHRDEIEALSIYFNTPARRAEVTLSMVKAVLKKLTDDRPRLAPLNVWRAYAHLDEYKGDNPASDLTALVALIRRVTGLDETLTRNSDRVRRNFQNWIMKRHSGAGEKFSEAQMEWLHMIRDHLATSFTIERDDLELSPFDARGGMGQMYALFGDQMDDVMTEMNEALSA
ncbi:DEAD/DEAH box helicase family protein [Phaeobacter gallaeciensis]|uniref:type I restriction endonuclease subunit R n=1 Tax=Phaeobacter gallaeciensis TaxID=60890 RepID=UPI00237F99A7|nr:DEAD/DEAH box helicase family protein [Phaeobacter gallaeciensis]MDE4063791.1 type I restriction-modification enzyme R subunit C-terminal domain-containing protein [Phaeobacter gallaeciensis]MDE4126832.1 type I restriction-modification enzyme R subunit C-terminal domain-containing protein [Phaeobacter gallaeciensis]MDE4131299.1 type I restriction-modification enzyme R subunit C-terminal domain-containing protein [Phaeobacter gallaeciensis]